MKNFLLYVAMFFLFVLLLLPPGLRLFAKDLYEKKEVKQDLVESLSCNKLNESINISYLNGKAYNFTYNKSGDFSTVMGQTFNEDDVEYNKLNIIRDIKDFATIDYSKINDITKFSISFSSFTNLPESLMTYAKTPSEEIDLLAENGFSCIKTQ